MKRYLFPDVERGTRSRLLTHKALFFYIVFFLVLIPFVKFASTNYPDVLGFATDVSVEDLLADTNKERIERGLKPLSLNNELSLAAYRKAQDMFSKDYWAHVSPDGDTPWKFILNSGYDYRFAGENLARDFNDSDSVVEAWMNSSSHRENIINPNYEDIGFAAVDGVLKGEKTTLVVQMFGKKASPALASSPSVGKKATKAERSLEISEVSAGSVNGAVNKVYAEKKLPLINIAPLRRELSLGFGIFILILFALDMYYLRRRRIYMLSGNTFAHIALLLVSLAGVWYATAGFVL